MTINTEQLSDCCKKPVRTAHGCDDDILHGGKTCNCEVVTMWYECSGCKKPANIAIPDEVYREKIDTLKKELFSKVKKEAAPDTEQWKSDFWLMWGASPEGSMKYKKGIMVIDFIHQLIRTEKLKLLEQVKLEKREHPYWCRNNHEPITDLWVCICNTNGYNNAVRDLNAIREKLLKSL